MKLHTIRCMMTYIHEKVITQKYGVMYTSAEQHQTCLKSEMNQRDQQCLVKMWDRKKLSLPLPPCGQTVEAYLVNSNAKARMSSQANKIPDKLPLSDRKVAVVNAIFFCPTFLPSIADLVGSSLTLNTSGAAQPMCTLHRISE